MEKKLYRTAFEKQYLNRMEDLRGNLDNVAILDTSIAVARPSTQTVAKIFPLLKCVVFEQNLMSSIDRQYLKIPTIKD